MSNGNLYERQNLSSKLNMDFAIELLTSKGIRFVAKESINVIDGNKGKNNSNNNYKNNNNNKKNVNERKTEDSKGTSKLKTTKLSSEKIELDWLPSKYTAVEVKGTIKVGGKDVDVSRRVYQIEIDKNYIPNDPSAKGASNEELMKKGRSPYVVINGIESKVELHHLIQKEPGSMVEIAEITHKMYKSTLHGLIENGASFRNNPELAKQYDNFRKNYWKMRVKDL